MTRFTRESPFKDMCHQTINPPKSITIIVTANSTIKAEKKENPVNKNVTKKIARSESPNDHTADNSIVRYCS